MDVKRFLKENWATAAFVIGWTLWLYLQKAGHPVAGAFAFGAGVACITGAFDDIFKEEKR
jgi:hypothetical protein